MITVKRNGTPRILVRIRGEDRHGNKLEKKIRDNNGNEITLHLATLTEDNELRKEELAVQIGEVIGVGEGAEGYQIGDIVLMDYNVDSDEQYKVCMEGKDKIVCVPCVTTYHEKPYLHTTYGSQPAPNVFVKTGERNMLIWDAGEVNEISLVYGIVREKYGKPELLPNPYWVFCYHEEDEEELQAIGGIMAYRKYYDTYVRRVVQFASAEEKELMPGTKIMALLQSAITVTVNGVKFDVIARVDIFAIDKTEPKKQYGYFKPVN